MAAGFRVDLPADDGPAGRPRMQHELRRPVEFAQIGPTDEDWARFRQALDDGDIPILRRMAADFEVPLKTLPMLAGIRPAYKHAIETVKKGDGANAEIARLQSQVRALGVSHPSKEIMQTHTRNMAIRADSINGGGRVMTAVVATENPVVVWSDEDRSLVDEILLVSGAEVPDQVPFLLDHRREIPSTIGSVRNFRRQDNGLVADLFFATGVEAADSTWQLASQRHVLDVSVGYQVHNEELLQPGESKVIRGKQYTAPPIGRPG